MHQEPLTVLASVPADNIAALQGVLAQMHAAPADNPIIPLGRLDRAHFARLFLLEPAVGPSGEQVDAQLVLMSDCDGSADAHLEEFVDVGGSGIDHVFGLCREYPARPASRVQRLAYLRARGVTTATYYAHHMGRTVAQIRAEAALRDAIEAYLDEARFDGLSASAVRERIRTFVESQPSLAWAMEAPEPLEWSFRVRELLHALALPAGAAAFFPVVAPATLALLGLVRLHELRDQAPRQKPTLDHIAELASVVDFVAQNPYGVVGFVKPGLVRRVALEAALRLASYGTRHLYTHDSLGGVKSIHFARWVAIDGYRRVLFASNYDGSLESYMDDFIDKIAWGLNLVFSNGVGYPKTRWLIKEGAKREQEFKDINVRLQVPTQVWYSAYDDLTTLNIQNNAEIRAGLRGRMSEDQAREWLALL